MVTVHAVNTMAGFCKHEFVDTIVTGATFEAVGVVRVVTGQDSFVEDGLLTNATAVWAVGADGLTIREEKKIRVGGDPVATLGAFETVDVKEGLSLVTRDFRETGKKRNGRWEKKMKEAHPNAITTPPSSSMTVRWHPGHILCSVGETESGRREPEVVGEWVYGKDCERSWDEGEMAASIWNEEEGAGER
jgi:hypothetical protein